MRLLALLLLAAPALAQPAVGCAQHEGAFAALLGRNEAAVRAALAALPGIRTIRVGGPASAMTQDYSPDRATVLVDRGVVLRITCG